MTEHPNPWVNAAKFLGEIVGGWLFIMALISLPYVVAELIKG